MGLKPFKGKRLLVVVNGNVVGVVEGMSLEFIKEGGVEPHYCSETGKHAIGTKHATFSIRRWMWLDTHKRLLWDLWNNDTQFVLEFGLCDMQSPPDFVTGSRLVLSDCVGYRWRPVTGSANDTVAEELVGEATAWDDSEFAD